MVEAVPQYYNEAWFVQKAKDGVMQMYPELSGVVWSYGNSSSDLHSPDHHSVYWHMHIVLIGNLHGRQF